MASAAGDDPALVLPNGHKRKKISLFTKDQLAQKARGLKRKWEEEAAAMPLQWGSRRKKHV